MKNNFIILYILNFGFYTCPVFQLLFCNKLPPKLSKKQPFYFGCDFMTQELEESSGGYFYLGISHKSAIRCWLGLESSENTTGPDVQVGSLMWLAVDAGSWLSIQLGLSPELFTSGLSSRWSQDCQTSDKVADFPQSLHPKRTRKKLQHLLWPSLRSYIPSLLLNFMEQSKHKFIQIQKAETWSPLLNGRSVKEFLGHVLKSPQPGW